MYKIYIQNKPLFLIDKPGTLVKDYIHRPEVLFLDEPNFAAISTTIQQLEDQKIPAAILQHHNLAELLFVVKSHFTVIVAAGGLVHTKENELLLIFRKGKWDLPKGKLDEDENLEKCAIREIKEETGALDLTIINLLQNTYHTYYENEKHILKETYWFLISTNKRSPLQPQTEEDIEKCEWVKLGALSDHMNNMHASIIDVINTGKTVLEKT
ncbi:MAG: NUDIX domain-containing protein [Bacteroidota bacterium]|nr:NUDIX domain-containing protein [Bacteroidota bacterium]